MTDYVIDLMPQCDEYVPLYWEESWDAYECEIWEAPDND